MPSDQAELFPSRSEAGVDDVLIVGGGIAGLYCALKLSPRPVTVLLAGAVGEGAASARAQAGIAAALAEGDTPEKHLTDTLAVGCGLVDEKIARMMIEKAGDCIDDLLEWGTPFDREKSGKLRFSREAAHSLSRVVGVRGDGAGKAIMETLSRAVRECDSIRLLEGFAAERLVVNEGVVTGLIARGEKGFSPRSSRFEARATILATGGIGHLYAATTNPPQARGEGLGMAARAGAAIADAEFVQFHPTAMDVGEDPAPLATEALRGRGCTLCDSEGNPFMSERHPLGDLAPRDVAALEIFRRRREGSGAWLDCRKALGERFEEEFPAVHLSCRKAGIDPAKEMIPVMPAAHYHMGGVLTDGNGRSTLDGLWAIGEVASTGAHGANRLASNSLLEAMAFASGAAEDVNGLHASAVRRAPVESESPPPSPEDEKALSLLRRVMDEKVGVARAGEGLRSALEEMNRLEETATKASRTQASATQGNIRFLNLLSACRLIAASALLREESRGSHFREDFPEEREEFKSRSHMTLAEAEAVGSR